MSKLAIQGLLAITATLWLAQPIETSASMAVSRNQISTEQARDGETPVNKALPATGYREGGNQKS